jgi:hypothetical protein
MTRLGTLPVGFLYTPGMGMTSGTVKERVPKYSLQNTGSVPRRQLSYRYFFMYSYGVLLIRDLFRELVRAGTFQT